jgi:hypothetical protein
MRQIRQQMARDVGYRCQPLPTFAHYSGRLPITFTEATFAGRAAAAHWRRPDTAAWSGDQMTPLGLACRALTDGGQFPGCGGARKVHGESTEHLCAPHGLNVLRGTFLALYRP